MLAGALDRRITLKRATIAQDDFGQGVKTWETLATVWASRKPVLDAERLQAGEITAEAQVRFQIRYSTDVADLNPKDRVEYGGVVYEIWGVKEIGRRVGLEISATARPDLEPAFEPTPGDDDENGTPLGLLLALTYSSEAPAAASGRPFGLLLSLTAET